MYDSCCGSMMPTKKFFQLFLLAIMLVTGRAFAPPERPVRSASLGTSLQMSVDVGKDKKAAIGETERLILEAAAQRGLGLKQELGKTIKKDGLDGLRAVVWGLFDASQFVFGCLAVALSAGLLLNLLGYGYFFDWDQGGFVIDTLDNIRQDKLMAAEAGKLASEAAQKLKAFDF